MTRYVMIPNYEKLNSATDTQLVKGESLKECARACDDDETFTWYFRIINFPIKELKSCMLRDF